MSKSLPVLPALVKETGFPFGASEPAFPSERGLVRLPTVKSEPNFSTEATFKNFLARQTNASQDVRLEIAIYQRDKLAEMRAESASCKFVGVTHFKKMLVHRFGSITSAWKQCLDPTSIGKVSFVDFCQCCRDIGYARRMKQLWAELDTQKKGWISRSELDPEGAQLVRDFRDSCRFNYGEMLDAWHAFDLHKSHKLDEEEFVKCCADMSFLGNARPLFHMLKIDIGRKFLTIQDFDSKSMQRLHRGDDKMMTVTSNRGSLPSVGKPFDSMRGNIAGDCMASFPPAMGAALDTCKEELSPMSAASNKKMDSTLRRTSYTSETKLKDRADYKKMQYALDQGMKGVHELKRALIMRFGSIYSGWRQALDLEGKGRLSFGEFCLALRTLGYSGNLKECFAALDFNADGFITLNDLDEKVDEEIRSYKQLALLKYSNMLAAWQSLDVAGAGQVDEEAFTKHCKVLGWSGVARSLFNNLKEEKSRRFLVLRDYDAHAASALLRGDLAMISEEKATKNVDKSNVDMMMGTKQSFHERQGNSFSQRWGCSQSKQDRSDLEKVHKEHKAKDKGCHDADSLRVLLVRKYTTMPAAWKQLDVNSIGRLPFGEFSIAMRRLGFTGNIPKTFKELDTDGKGSVTLRDLDAEAHEIITEFRELLLDKYGTYIKAWQAMDLDKNGTIEANEMVEACAAIGYSKDPEKLFKYLLDAPGKRNLTMGDLDPVAMQAYYRGDLEALTKVEKARASLLAIQKSEKDHLDKTMVTKDWPSLKRALTRKFGTVTAAWRNILDVESNGKVSLVDFSKRIRDFGFGGDIKQMFQELDTDNSGIITFNEVDKSWYHRISQFNELLLTKYLSYDTAWIAMDKNKNNVVELNEFVQLCDELGYFGSSKALFRQLLKNPLAKYLSLEDVEGNALIIQSNKADTTSSMMFYKTTDSMMSGTQRAKRDLSDRQALFEQEKGLQSGASSWPQLKDQLKSKYGTITAAWRHALDVSGDGKLAYTDFCKACRNNSFQGNIHQCFIDLDLDANGIVTFNEVDPDWFAKLHAFKDLVFERYGDFEMAWKFMDTNKNNMLECEELEKVCTELGYKDDPRALFQQLLVMQGGRFLTLEDLNVCTVAVGAVKKAKP